MKNGDKSKMETSKTTAHDIIMCIAYIIGIIVCMIFLLWVLGFAMDVFEIITENIYP
jgi:hypothetical protein